MISITDLKCEYGNGVPVDTRKPRFSWRLCGEGRAIYQDAFRIQVAQDHSFSPLLWDSDFAVGGHSRFVEYRGPDLSSRSEYFFRVRVRLRSGEESAWSEAARFRTGFFEEQWSAPFIAPEGGDDAEPRPLYFRREFEMPEAPADAVLYASALGVYELYLNGERVGNAAFTPGWTNYPKRLAYQSYELGARLKAGRNTLAAIVADGWYRGELSWLRERNIYGTERALSVDLRYRKLDGEEGRLTSDTAWRVGSGPLQFAELYHGERYDGRLDLGAWSAPGYDDKSWAGTRELSVDSSVLIAQDGPYAMVRNELPVRALIVTPKGEQVLDFGQNLTGWVSFRVQGSPGAKVILKHAEILDAQGNFYTENMRSARNTIEYTLAGGGEESFEPRFSSQGFRFVKVEEWPGNIDPGAFTAKAVHSEMEETLEFSCSHELLGLLHRNILWGWKGNALDIPTDCPQRDERLGWTGDAQVFVGTAAYLTDANHFFRKWLRDLASEQRENGGIPFVVPDVLARLKGQEPMFRDSHSSTGWGDAAVVCPWTMYERYADLQLLAEQYSSMRAWVEYIRSVSECGTLWNSGFHFGDWVALDAKEGSYFGATPNDLTATAFYAYSVSLLARAAKALGKEEDACAYGELLCGVKDAFRREFYTPAGRLAARTQTAHVLALAFGLVPEEHRWRTARDLAALLKENDGHLTTGFLGTPFICRALADNGLLTEAYALLLKEDYPSWLYQVKAGATTVWEHWDGMKADGTLWSAAMNSFNHYAYGAVGQWMYETIGGLRPAEDTPGFKVFIIEPRPGGGICSCRISYRSPYGPICSGWELQDCRFSLTISVPPNTTARLVLTGVDAREVEGDGKGLFVDGKDRLGRSAATAEIGSGSYALFCPAPHE